MDPFVDLDFSRVNVPCPQCGAKLDADALGGYFLRCRDAVCGWRGSVLSVRINEKVKVVPAKET